MATVYKIEVEIVSDKVNYTPEQLKEMVTEAIESNTDASNPTNDISVSEIEVERKA